MIRIVIVLFTLIILYSCGTETDDIDFIQVNTRTSQDISSIDIFNNELIAVGGEVFQQGVVMTGKDKNWVTQDSFSNKRLFGIDCGEDQCIAVGQDGYFYSYSEDDSWNFTRLSAWGFQRAIHMTANHTVSVSGKSFQLGEIYVFNSQNKIDTIITLESQLQDITSLDDDTFIAVGYGTIMRSDDGGQNWEYINKEGDFYHSIDFIDDQNGIIVGVAGTILSTKDGGQNWEYIKRPSTINANRTSFLSVKYINSMSVYIVGDNGLLWHSDDGGNSWNAYQVNTMSNLNDVCVLDGKLYIVGDDGYMGLKDL